MMSHSGREVTLEQLFRDKSLAIDENEFSNTWLVDIPNLAEECTNTTLVSLVGETIEISGEVYHVNREETFEELSKLLTPRFLRDAFPVTSASGQISRILLRREFIQRWNAQVGSLGSADIDRYPKQIVLCAAVGMGKSIDLYLTAVFARHCKLIVQYFADPSSLLEYEIEEELYEWFLKMILFMNAESLDLVDWRLSSSDEDKKHLNGLSLKCLIFYALKKKEFRFCSFVRKELINLQFPNMIIVDEHDGLWIEFSDYSPEWPKFFKFYSNIADMRSNYCGVLIAVSRHHPFSDGMWYRCHEFFRYLEPLNFEEYEKWKQLPDFPDILREHEAEVVELSGLVPGMIVELVKLSKDHRSFKRISAKFRRENLEAMKRKHMEYIRSPHYKELEFRQFLYSLFLKKSSPTTDLADVDYIDRGLLIAMNDKTLRFYNSVARDILIQSFLDVFRFR